MIIELASSSKNPFRSVSAFESVRPFIDGALADASDRIPPQLRDDIQIAIDELQFVVSETDFFGSLGKIELKLVANDSESAMKLAGALDRLRKNGMVIGEQVILQALKNEQQVSTEVKAAAMQYMLRLKAFLSKAELWTVNGNEIAIKGEFAYTVPTIGVLTGLLLGERQLKYYRSHLVALASRQSKHGRDAHATWYVCFCRSPYLPFKLPAKQLDECNRPTI